MGQPTINLSADLNQAMKAKDAPRISVLRMLLAVFNNSRIDKRADLTEAEKVALLKKEAKKRQESIDMYQKAGRQELADQESFELQLIKEYLPSQMEL